MIISLGLLGVSPLTDPEPALWAIGAIALSWPAYQWIMRRSRKAALAASA